MTLPCPLSCERSCPTAGSSATGLLRTQELGEQVRHHWALGHIVWVQGEADRGHFHVHPAVPDVLPNREAPRPDVEDEMSEQVRSTGQASTLSGYKKR